MKNFSLILSTILISIYGFSQNVTIKTIQDDPTFVSDKLINIGIPFGYSQGGNITVGLDLDAYWNITKGIDAQGSFGIYPALLTENGGSQLELGGTYSLTSKTKKKETKVVLKWSDRTYETATERIRERSVQYVNSIATYLKSTKLRAGLFRKSGGYIEKNNGLEVEATYNSFGLYGGLEFSNQAALVSEIDGIKGITSGFSRLYVDGFVLPLTNIDNTSNGFGAGGRIGFWTIFNPNKAKKSSLGRLEHYQAYQTMFFKTELGYRPIEKIYFMFTFGLNVYKNR